jgi:hypothetical protein
MWFRSLASYFRPRPVRRPIRYSPQPATACRLLLEALEDRTVPSFMAPVTYSVGTLPQAIVTADLNHDGRLDLITANAGSNNISVALKCQIDFSDIARATRDCRCHFRFP